MEKDVKKACAAVVEELSARVLEQDGRTMSAGEKSALASHIAAYCEKRGRNVPHIKAVEAAYDRGYELVRVSELPDAEVSFSWEDEDGATWCVCGFSLMEDWRKVDEDADTWECCPIDDSLHMTEICSVDRCGWTLRAVASTDDDGYAPSDDAWLFIFDPEGNFRGWGDLDYEGESMNQLQYGFPFTDRNGYWDPDWDMDDLPFLSIDELFDGCPTGEEFGRLAEEAGVRFRRRILEQLKERTRDWLPSFMSHFEADMDEAANGYEWPTGAGETSALLSLLEEKEGELYELADGYDGAAHRLIICLIAWSRECVEAGKSAYEGDMDGYSWRLEAAEEELSNVRRAKKKEDDWSVTRSYWNALRDSIDCDHIAAWWSEMQERLKAECERRAALKK